MFNRSANEGSVQGSGSVAQRVTLLSWVLPLSALLLSEDTSRAHSYLLYAAQLGLFMALWNRTGALATLLSPISLLILYVDASFLLGNYAFGRGMVLHKGNYADFLQWRYLHLANFYVLMQNVLLFHLDAWLRARAAKEPRPERVNIPASSQWTMATISLLFLALFSIMPLDVAFLGGDGDMSGVPKTVSVLVLIYIMAYRASLWRYLAYAAILLVSAAVSYTNKRDAIFLVFPILLLEAVLFERVLRWRTYLAVGILGAFLSTLIILMSLMRGYGGFDTADSGLLAMAPYIVRYLQLEDFLPYFFNNIETNYTYFHTMQAFEYIFGDPGLLAFGSSIVKVFFIALPASAISWKPDSFIDLYTSLHDPAFRAVGGSWPPNVMAEMFWNFHFLGLAVLPLIFWAISSVYYRILRLIRNGSMLKHVWVLFGYMQILTYARGSGLDMFAVYLLFGAAFSFLYVSLFQALASAKRAMPAAAPGTGAGARR